MQQCVCPLLAEPAAGSWRDDADRKWRRCFRLGSMLRSRRAPPNSSSPEQDPPSRPQVRASVFLDPIMMSLWWGGFWITDTLVLAGRHFLIAAAEHKQQCLEVIAQSLCSVLCLETPFTAWRNTSFCACTTAFTKRYLHWNLLYYMGWCGMPDSWFGTTGPTDPHFSFVLQWEML